MEPQPPNIPIQEMINLLLEIRIYKEYKFKQKGIFFHIFKIMIK